MWFLQPGITFEYLVMRILAVLLIVFLVLPFHGFMHAFIAYKLGDKTAKSMGIMTLNPLVHFDTVGAVCMLLFDFGWTKHIPIDSSNFKNPRRDAALVSLGGPFAHIIASLLGGFAMNFLIKMGLHSSAMYSFFMNYISINVGLTVINLVPLSVLDGYEIFEALIPKRFLESYYKHQRTITIAVFFLLLFGFFSAPMTFLSRLIYNFILQITSLPF